MDFIKDLCPYCFAHVKDNVCEKCGKKYNKTDFSPTHLKPLTLLKGRYIVGTTLGAGGFGITYRGLDRMSNDLVAIKEYFPSGLLERTADGNVVPVSDDARMRFLQGRTRFATEAKNMAQVARVDGIAKALDLFSENGTVYIVMEYLDGMTFYDFLHKIKRPSFVRIFRLLSPVSTALECLHEAGFVHGDVSPDNVMILRSGQCKLIDFGATVHADAFGDRPITLKKKFAPPEQYGASKIINRKADVYAFGVTIYYAITGSLPPESPDRIKKDGIKLPRTLGAKISEAEQNALMVALAPSPAHRFASMADMQKTFEDAVAQDVEAGNEKPMNPTLFARLFE